MTDKGLLYLLIFSIVLICGCTGPKQDESAIVEEEIVLRDIDEIRSDGKLRVLTIYSSTSYFLYRGQTMGFEYELLKRFAEFLDLELEIIVAKDIDSLFYQLNEGQVDLVAHGLTVTEQRKRQVSFTEYLYLTHQVLIQKKPDNWRDMKWSDLQNTIVHDAIELIGDTVSVRRNSAYHERLTNLSKEIGGQIVINPLPGHLSTDEIIKMVVDGEIKYTVADNNLAKINASFYPVLHIDVPISFSQRIAWAVRKTSPKLLSSANQWLEEMKDTVDYYVIYNKYFENERSFRQRIKSDFYSLNNEKISQYDHIIKRYADGINWDWRLLSALIYQESRFKPEANSWADAAGLMQVMPSTAEELGIKDISDPEENIKGGTRYLEQLWEKFDMVKDSVQRIKFTMAAYNCGMYHVIDAQALAKAEGLNPTRWDDNVEDMILELSYPNVYNQPIVKFGYVRGIEPYTYVRQIFDRYDHYSQFVD
ncbi:MAG: transporter substrate-binding domain-containing protein [Cyclobacteriaceae bacterium]|nr:transporter substrate-binding domain-containing protein [Cyclobacteriaceae bacterium SS2]